MIKLTPLTGGRALLAPNLIQCIQEHPKREAIRGPRGIAGVAAMPAHTTIAWGPGNPEWLDVTESMERVLARIEAAKSERTYVVYRESGIVGHVSAKNLRHAERIARSKYGLGCRVAIQ